MKRASLIILVISCWGHVAVILAQAEQIEAGNLFVDRRATLYYEIRGGKAGTPLMVINGGPGVGHSYMHSTLHPVSALDVLGEDRPVVLYDQRGVGKSPPLQQGQSCTVADQVDDLEALRAHLGYERINILGHSFGGYLAIAYATRYPERMERLILCNSAAARFADTIFLFAEVYPETQERLQAIKITNEATKRAAFMEYFSMLFYSPHNRDTYLRQVTEIDASTEIGAMLHKDMEGLDFTAGLANFGFPTLVITGRFDMNVAPSVAYAMHKAIHGSRFKVFEQSGHLPFYEEQEGFVRVVRDFLSE